MSRFGLHNTVRLLGEVDETDRSSADRAWPESPIMRPRLAAVQGELPLPWSRSEAPPRLDAVIAANPTALMGSKMAMIPV